MGLGITTERQVFNSGALKELFLSYIMKNEAKRIGEPRRKKIQTSTENRTELDNYLARRGQGGKRRKQNR